MVSCLISIEGLPRNLLLVVIGYRILNKNIVANFFVIPFFEEEPGYFVFVSFQSNTTFLSCQAGPRRL